jgi:aurora kinase, other
MLPYDSDDNKETAR